MRTYKIDRDGEVLRIGFGASARSDEIVRDVVARLVEMDASGELGGGGVIKLNGAASVPAAVAIAHRVAHRFSAVGVFDPKLGRYVVAISHDPAYRVGDLID